MYYMIFMSDIDRTLIFTNKRYGFNPNKHVLYDSGIDGLNIISGMTKESSNYLNFISRTCEFIPNTSRTLEEFKRVDFDSNKIKVDYASVDNGLTMIKRKEDNSWEVIKTFETGDKSNAVPFFKELLGSSFVVSGGDNVKTDLPMLKASDKGYFLETFIYNLESVHDNVEIIENNGLYTSEDYLEKIHNIVTEKKYASLLKSLYEG